MSQMIRMLVLVTDIVVLGDRGAGAQGAGDVAAVEAANRAFYEAASARDLVQMDAIWAHEPYVRAIHPGRPMDEGWEAVSAGWQGLFQLFADISVSMPQPHVRASGNMAWVTGE
jgi:ketosteroid isomerase-like protein